MFLIRVGDDVAKSNNLTWNNNTLSATNFIYYINLY